jgi:hypothetical protein
VEFSKSMLADIPTAGQWLVSTRNREFNIFYFRTVQSTTPKKGF